MKMPVSWHKDCLANARHSAKRGREEAERLMNQAAELEARCIAYDAQIIRAELEGVAAFDREIYGKKRPRQPQRGEAK